MDSRSQRAVRLALQAVRERRGVLQPAGHVHRLVAQRNPARARLRPVHRLGKPRHQACAQRTVLVAERGERLLKQAHEDGVQHAERQSPGRDRREPERRARDPFCVPAGRAIPAAVMQLSRAALTRPVLACASRARSRAHNG